MRATITTLAIMASLALSGCNVLVGDSIGRMSTTQIAAAVPRVVIDTDIGRAAYGRGIDNRPDGWATIRTLAPQVRPGEWLIVELGTNDLLRGTTSTRWATFVDNVVDLLPDDRCLAWVTPVDPQDERTRATFERLLVDRIRRQPCHAVVHWGDIVRTCPHLTADLIHPTLAGGYTLAAAIADAITTIHPTRPAGRH